MREGQAPALVSTPTPRVRLASGDLDIESVAVSRTLGGSGLPGIGGLPAASGNCVVRAGAVVPLYYGSPWKQDGVWPPAPGESVVVSTGTRESGTLPALSGVVDEVDLDTEAGQSLSFIDPVDILSESVWIEPLLARMPPYERGGWPRLIGLQSDFIVATALREALVINTPYIPASAVGVSAILQGSAWPEKGECLNAFAYSNENLPADFRPIYGGFAMDDGQADYKPSGNIAVRDGITIALSSDSAATGHANVQLVTGGVRARVVVQSNRDVVVQASYDAGASWSTGYSYRDTSSWDRVTAYMTASGVEVTWSRNGTITRQSGFQAVTWADTTTNVETVRVQAYPGARISGLAVATNLSVSWYHGQTKSLNLSSGTTLNPKLLASPEIRDTPIRDLIAEIADKSLRVWWWDEDGILWWRAVDSLLTRTPATGLHAIESLVSYAVSQRLADIHRNVEVTANAPAISLTTSESALVWEGSSQSMRAGDMTETWVEPGSDEDWVQVDATLARAGWSEGDNLNHGYGSFGGGVVTSGQVTSWAMTGQLDWAFSRIGRGQTWKMTYMAGTLPAGSQVQTATANDDAQSSLWPHMRNQPLPRIAAGARVEWADKAAATSGAGPSAGGTYSHDAGRWMQGYADEAVPAAAEMLARWFTAPHPVLSGVEVVHDPRVQVGDVVTITDPVRLGVQLTVLVTGKHETQSTSGQSMSLDCFVIEGASLLGYTLADHDRDHAGETLTDHWTGRAATSLASHDVAPDHA